MNFTELKFELNLIDLSLIQLDETTYAVKSNHFANPMLYFTTTNKGKDYNGSITFKSYNLSTFTEYQVYNAIKLVNEYLLSEEL